MKVRIVVHWLFSHPLLAMIGYEPSPHSNSVGYGRKDPSLSLMVIPLIGDLWIPQDRPSSVIINNHESALAAIILCYWPVATLVSISHYQTLFTNINHESQPSVAMLPFMERHLSHGWPVRTDRSRRLTSLCTKSDADGTHLLIPNKKMGIKRPTTTALSVLAARYELHNPPSSKGGYYHHCLWSLIKPSWAIILNHCNINQYEQEPTQTILKSPIAISINQKL